MQNQIEQKLTQAFTPSHLEVINESHLHAGHSGDNGTGNSHFRVRITADAFDGKSRVERHRMIYGVLTEEMNGGIHALALEVEGRV